MLGSVKSMKGGYRERRETAMQGVRVQRALSANVAAAVAPGNLEVLFVLLCLLRTKKEAHRPSFGEDVL